MQTAQQKALIEQENMERVAKSFNTAMKGIGKIIELHFNKNVCLNNLIKMKEPMRIEL